MFGFGGVRLLPRNMPRDVDPILPATGECAWRAAWERTGLAWERIGCCSWGSMLLAITLPATGTEPMDCCWGACEETGGEKADWRATSWFAGRPELTLGIGTERNERKQEWHQSGENSSLHGWCHPNTTSRQDYHHIKAKTRLRQSCARQLGVTHHKTQM